MRQSKWVIWSPRKGGQNMGYPEKYGNLDHSDGLTFANSIAAQTVFCTNKHKN